MGNKRGISTKNSILLILILIVAITIIIIVVFKGEILETNKSLLSKVELDLDIRSVQIGDNSSINIKVYRNQGKGEIVGMRFIFESQDESEAIDINYLIQEGEESEFTVFLKEIDSEDLIDVKVSPIFQLEGEELTVGSVKDEYKILKSSI